MRRQDSCGHLVVSKKKIEGGSTFPILGVMESLGERGRRSWVRMLTKEEPLSFFSKISNINSEKMAKNCHM